MYMTVNVHVLVLLQHSPDQMLQTETPYGTLSHTSFSFIGSPMKLEYMYMYIVHMYVL